MQVPARNYSCCFNDNGLALCKLHHWAFDEHLIAINDSYNLIVSSGFEERGHSELLLRNMTGKKMLDQ